MSSQNVLFDLDRLVPKSWQVSELLLLFILPCLGYLFTRWGIRTI